MTPLHYFGGLLVVVGLIVLWLTRDREDLDA